MVIATLSLIVATAGGSLLRSQQRASWDISGGQVATVSASLDPARLLYTNPQHIVDLARRLAPAGSQIDITAGDDNSAEQCSADANFVQVPVAATMGSGVVVRAMRSGRWFDHADATSTAPAMVIDSTSDASLGHPGFVTCSFDPGHRTMVFRVVGVIDYAGVQTAFLDLSDPRVRIPEILGRGVSFAAALRVHGARSQIPAMTRTARDTVNLLALSASPIDATGVAREDGGAAVDELVGKVTVVMTVIALIMLGIAVLGILNIGFASVRERSEELTLRRALGASKLAVAGLMLIESALVGLGAVALALAISLLMYAAFVEGLTPISLPPVVPSYPATASLVGAAVALVAAMTAAVFPAIRATRVEPASMMRA